MIRPHLVPFAASAACAALALLGLQGAAADSESPPQDSKPNAAAVAAWDVIYRVLQHPRCANCHPADDVPRQGDAMTPHLQNVRRNKDGHGHYGMRCDTCHQTENLPGDRLPPGAPGWHLPPADMKMVFIGRSSPDLCRQMRDPAQNGGKTREQLYEHFAHDALVGWGWAPGLGRTPVPIPREDLARAVRAWIDHDCGCPDK
jgi:hypothetical protein